VARFDAQPLYAFDAAVERECGCRVAGTDEAGRGPLAGPVVAAAVVLDLNDPIDGIRDSKKLTPAGRELLYGQITSRAKAWAACSASVEEIERINILNASLLAMRRALDALDEEWSMVLVDGNRAIPGLPAKQRAVVKGDSISASVAAASIVAKVTRDRLMERYHAAYPQYSFNVNKGYGTKAHIARVLEHGLSPVHRRSFCVRLASQTELELNIHR
jgi:ribonuclease HII